MSISREELARRADGPVHQWFGLSYCSYLVLRRSFMQVMPTEWQERMVALLDEAAETIDTDDINGRFAVQLRNERGRFVADEYADYRRGPTPPLKDSRA